MLRLAADENFNNDIVRALRRHKPDIDIVSVQDAGLRGADDPTVLAWAASEGLYGAEISSARALAIMQPHDSNHARCLRAHRGISPDLL